MEQEDALYGCIVWVPVWQLMDTFEIIGKLHGWHEMEVWEIW